MRPTPLIAALLLALSPAAAQREFYVSPNGNDRHSGSITRPFRTITRARDAVRTFRATMQGFRGPVTVYLREGRYEVDQPITLGPEDGGTAESPAVYSAYRKERPVVSGGRELKGWRRGTMNGREVWRARLLLTPTEGVPTLRQMWAGGRLRGIARHPNKGYLRIAGVPALRPETAFDEGQTSLRFFSGDLPPIEETRGAEAIVMNLWSESHLPITGVDLDSSLLTFGWRSVYRLDKENPFYLLNLPEILDEPGEWFFDTDHREVIYLPVPGESLEGFAPIIPRLSRVLEITGMPAERRFVEYLQFRGITFSHTGWHLSDAPSTGESPRRGGFGQAAIGLPATVQADGLRHSLFEQCEVTHAGTSGLALKAGCTDNTINQCRFSDLGGGGILIGETKIPEYQDQRTSHNSVINCELGNLGLQYHSAVGIWIGQSPNNRLIHNHIHDLYYSGISIGWTWGYGPSAAGGNLVILNHVHHVGKRADGDGPILADMGGIYTLGGQPGTLIRQNFFHDIAARQYGGWGIYYDEGSTRIVSEENIVLRTSHEGFHQHYGKENVFRNNILAYGGGYQVRRDHEELHTSFAFEQNIVLWDSGSLLTWEDKGWSMVFDRNVYWRTDGRDAMADSLDFPRWRLIANDPRSLFADPLFRNPQGADFRFEPGSPALVLGFRPISVARAIDKTPVPVDTLRGPVGRGPKRFLYNNDGSNILMAYDSLTPSKAFGRVDPLVGTGVTTFLHNVNPGQNMGYPSAVASMYRWDPPGGEGKEGWGLLGSRMSKNLARLVRDSIDPVGMVIDRTRLRGMESFLTFRMNELHDVDKPESPLLSEFWKRHPNYRVGGYAGWGASALNYAIPEVRDNVYAILEEVCERYDLDGLELDFMRFPYYFPYQRDSMEIHARTMTAFVERVRRLIDGKAVERGKHILLAARVPSSLKGCAHAGLDPAAWCAGGLIDFLTVAPFLSTETNIPVSEFKAVCGTVPVYTGIEYTIGARQMTREEKRAAAALLYAAGADGIYLFNYFVAWDMGLQADMDVLRDLSHPDSLSGKDKLYTVAIPRYPVPNVSLGSQLPLDVAPDKPCFVTVRTNEARRPRSVTLRIECERDVDPDDIHVMFNGVVLQIGGRPERSMLFPQPVEYKPAPTSRSVEFAVDPALVETENRLRVQSDREARVDWVYLAVRH